MVLKQDELKEEEEDDDNENSNVPATVYWDYLWTGLGWKAVLVHALLCIATHFVSVWGDIWIANW